MKKIIVLMAFLMLVLTACSGGDANVGTNQRTFLGGTNGLIISFVEGEPPESVTDGGSTPFTVSVKLENRGEHEIPANEAWVSLKGVDPADFGVTADVLTKNPLDEAILKNDINPDTGQRIDSPPVFVTLPTSGQLNFENSLSGNSVFPMQVDVCYYYETKATAPLCLKENLLDIQDTDVCNVAGTKDVQNSGGPVQITSFEEFSAGPDKVSFSFTVKNLGNGELSEKGFQCDDSNTYENVVILTVDAGLPGLVCSGLTDGVASGTSYTGKVKLTTGERVVRCTQPANTGIDQVKIVNLAVEYSYLESVQKSLLVKHIG